MEVRQKQLSTLRCSDVLQTVRAVAPEYIRVVRDGYGHMHWETCIKLRYGYFLRASLSFGAGNLFVVLALIYSFRISYTP